MKRPLQLSLAIALALSGSDALALGLGTIHVNSKLNQPLDADIPIVQGNTGEAEGLLVQLAAAEDFERVGLNRSRLSVPLEFSLVKGARGELSIKVTSKDVVREPFLDFLVEANWPKGRLLREYTVLLDPPVMAPATGTAVTSAAKTTERAPMQPLPETKPKAAPPKPKSAPVAAAPRSEAPSKPAPAAPTPKHEAASGEYTVEAGDTLSGIARDMRQDESQNINQLMLALLKQNPNAFYKDNINALKRGAILRIPSADQVKSVGSAGEAAAQVHAQIEDWRGGAASKPTLVADTGAKPEPKAEKPPAKTSTSSSAPTAKTGSERLELVPPKAGKDSVAMADRPGSGAGSPAATTELRSELARTKEALASRDQETGELKSRVKELEDTKSKSERLLNLKDSEIADLQRKLKDLQQQDKSGAKPATSTASTTPSTSPATTPVTPPASTTAPSATAPSATDDKVSKADIWGTASPDAKTTATTTPPPASGTGTPPSAATTTPEAGSTPPVTTSTATSTPPSSTTSGTATGSPDASSTTASSSTTPAATTTTPSTTTTPPTTTDTTAASTPSASTSTTPSATTPPVSATPPAKKASTTPLKPDAKTNTQTLSSAWYEQSWVKPAAIGAGALLLLAALLGMRKRKAATPERASIAGAFGDTPIAEGSAYAATPSEVEEQALRDQLADDPGNLGLHLELLSLLYAERNIDAFEDAAEAMHAQVIDPHQPEWLEARAMGQELSPHNPLFGDTSGRSDEMPFDDEGVTAPHAMPFDHDDVFHSPTTAAEPAPSAHTAFDFDLGGDDASSAPSPAVPASEAAFTFDALPPLDFGKEAHHEIEAAEPLAPLPVDEDEFANEDGVGTKLDLAKAYLDMGDPEGARSMLEEVLAEGNDTQRGEARRLMAELR